MMKNFKSSWFSTLILALAAAIAYLPQVGMLGYYKDDWFLIYDAHTQGANFFQTIYSIDRPARGYFMQFFYTWFGDHALYYHLAAYAYRVIAAVALLWILNRLWARSKQANFTIALLFAIYPGFLSQTNPIDYQCQLLSLSLGLLSLALTVQAILSPRPWLRSLCTVVAILLGWMYLPLVEYFIGLEVFRILLLFQASRVRKEQPLKSQFVDTVRAWLPFATIPAGFLAWRLFLFNSERRATDVSVQLGQLFSSPLTGLWWLIMLVQDASKSIFLAWSVPLYNLAFDLRLRDMLIGSTLALVLASLAVLGLWLISRREDFSPEDGPTSRLDFLWFGLVVVFAGLLPVAIVNRHADFGDYSRYLLASSVGAGMVVTALLCWLGNYRLRMALVALLVFASGLTHYANSLKAASEWDALRNFWWQVAWRAPDIKNGTTLIASYPVGAIQEDYFVWGPANLIYRPTKQSSLPIEIKIPAAVLTDDALFQIMRRRGNEIQERRGNNVVRDYGNVLVLAQSSVGGCVRILDGASPNLSVLDPHAIILAGPASNLSNVLTSAVPSRPPASIFGSEPDHGWCYYYQQASLARQRGDWELVALLGDQALAAGYYPSDRVEWMPFLEAYTVLGQKDKFRHIVPILIEEPFLADQACRNLTALGAAERAIDDQMRALIQQSFCR